jgi:ABC-2 type transport system ATP-binding protein
MIRVLLGFLRPSGGRASVFGLDCWRDSHRLKTDVGYLPGDLRLYSSMTGETHLRICGAIRGSEMLAPGTALAERFALDLRVPVRKMSRGMRQKLGLVLALAHRPRLLILDEPTASLDPLMRDALIRHLKQMASEGHTVFFSSHTLSEVERLCDRVAIVREGRLVADRSLDALRAEARRQVTILWDAEAGPAGIDAPPFLAVDERRGRLWLGSLKGPVPQFIRWAHDQPIEDLTIGHPDLDSLFRRYYEPETDDS